MNYTQWLTKTALLLALTLTFQMLGFPFFITGPLVNMMLFISVMISGWLGGVLIGSLTPWIAFVRGILPPPLAPMIPFIMIGNVILVIIFSLLFKRNKYLAIISAALLKFAALATTVNFLVDIPPQIASMMQLPQFFTAIGGGILALMLLKLLQDKIDLNLVEKV